MKSCFPRCVTRTAGKNRYRQPQRLFEADFNLKLSGGAVSNHDLVPRPGQPHAQRDTGQDKQAAEVLARIGIGRGPLAEARLRVRRGAYAKKSITVAGHGAVTIRVRIGVSNAHAATLMIHTSPVYGSTISNGIAGNV